MARSQDLYQAICKSTGRKDLTDEEIHKIVLFLQRRLRQPGDAADLDLGELGHINADRT